MHMCTYIYVCVCECVSVSVSVSVCVCECECGCECECECVCVRVRVPVCVYHLNRCKTSINQRRHLPGTRANVPAGLWWCTWAHLSRSWWPPQSHIYI